MKKILPLLIVFIFSLFLAPSIRAAGEFSASYKVTYSVNPEGFTDVSEEIKLKNLTDKFFPSSFSVVLPGNGLSDALASDGQGTLEVLSEPDGANTKLTVKFTNQQIIGLNKEYAFKLNFKDKNIAKNLGKVWMVNIPKLTQGSKLEPSTFVLSVPTAFGDPDYIAPAPLRLDESAGRINFSYDEKSFFNSGVTAIFGRALNFSFKANYQVQNNSIFPRFIKVALPVNSSLQKSYVETIDPIPDNTETDGFGNTLAVFKLNPGQKQDVAVSGEVSTVLSPDAKDLLTLEEKTKYLADSKYSDPENPAIKNKLSEILALNNPTTNFEKAKQIDKFVSNFLRYKPERTQSAFQRFGSVTALNNPEQALAAEFVDLEIALLRSAGIPARQVIGFALPSENKPFSYTNKSLHTWVEFYDDEQGWVTADPAWENTTGGAEFFGLNDLNHIKIANYDDRADFILPSEVKTEIFEGEVAPRQGAQLDVEVKPEILSGFPSRAKIKIRNLGNTTFPSSELTINTSKILLELENNEPSQAQAVKTPALSPFGALEYDLNLKTGAIWHSYQDVLQVTFAGVTDTHVLSVVPVLSYKIFAVEILGGVIMIALFYILIFLVHHRSAKRS